MKRVLIGAFAHPDDEAFGPSGTLLKEVKDGTELHLICATRGEAGINPDKQADLGAARQAEWQQSCQLLGATTTLQLGYPDGGLSNQFYLEIADKIMAQVKATLTNHDEAIDLQFMTFEPGGLTGHLDHVTISLITTFVYEKLRTQPLPCRRLIPAGYTCRPDARKASLMNKLMSATCYLKNWLSSTRITASGTMRCNLNSSLTSCEPSAFTTPSPN